MENPSPLESSNVLMSTMLKPFDWIDNLKQYLAINPVAISIRNMVSVALGEGGTLGFAQSKKAIQQGIEDLLQL